MNKYNCDLFMSRPKKSTTLRQFLFQDFDSDGVKNIDDPYPYDKSRSRWPDAKKKPSYYHKARYGGFDTKMSTVLMEIEKNNNNHGVLMRSFIRENPGSSGRVKTIPSTIGKLSKQGLSNLHDVAGAKVISKDRKSARAKKSQIRKKYRNDPKEYDDFYRTPGKGGYRAFHVGLVGKNNRRCEVQVKTKPFDDLSVEMHEVYKRGGDLSPFEKRALKFFKQGF